MQTAILEEQIVYKIGLLDPIQKQTVYSFIDFLLSEQSVKPSSVQQASLLQVSVWEEEALAQIEETQQRINAWQPQTF